MASHAARAAGAGHGRTPAPDVGNQLGDVVLRPVRGHHAFEGCVEQLATAIRLGVYPTGSPLPPERDLAQRMSVSRATLREAIAALRQAKMVSTTRGRGGGTVVAYEPVAPAYAREDADELDASSLGARREQLLDCLVYRRVVEPGAAWTAASRTLPAADRLLLNTALHEVDQALERGGPAAHRQADSRFHLAIASITGSPATIRAVTDVQACLHEMLQLIPVLPVNIDHSTTQHRTIADAILLGAPAKARRAMERHCDDTAALLRGLLA
jgi:GntR family transcriptional regulator, transcriptional repressor for pyruvate dehydrogenase complex